MPSAEKRFDKSMATSCECKHNVCREQYVGATTGIGRISPVHHGMLCVQVCTDNDINTDSTDHYICIITLETRVKSVGSMAAAGEVCMSGVYSVQTYSQQ